MDALVAGVPGLARAAQLQAEQIHRFREEWAARGWDREPRVSVSRSIFALVDDRDRAYFGRRPDDDQVEVAQLGVTHGRHQHVETFARLPGADEEDIRSPADTESDASRRCVRSLIQ